MENQTHIEKNTHRTNLQRLLHTLCLLLPIAGAFTGYYISKPIWNFFSEAEMPELFCFIFSILFFSIISAIIFVLTKKTNSIIKINIIKKEQA